MQLYLCAKYMDSISHLEHSCANPHCPSLAIPGSVLMPMLVCFIKVLRLRMMATAAYQIFLSPGYEMKGIDSAEKVLSQFRFRRAIW